ncbi:DsbA family oxidoreductase [Deinococcus radiomollis]|uniref:DsbA family oxidoreductase n=1 Tax=Deinococcus radiomollis TaxID=468916 RepID=UPI0038917808
MTATLTPLPGTASLPRITVDIWSDIACPWCFIGKRRFEAALAEFPQAGQVDVVWHSFELDPNAELAKSVNMRDALTLKYGVPSAQAQEMMDNMTRTAAEEGLEYHFERTRLTNTFQAHQVIHLAAEHGLQGEMKERFLKAYMSEGAHLGDPEVLVSLAVEVGLDRGEVRSALENQTYAAAVRQDEAQARAYGIQGVPFFVLGGKYGVSGAQSPETLLGALGQVWSEVAPQPAALQLIGAGGIGADSVGDGCEDGSCAVPGMQDS